MNTSASRVAIGLAVLSRPAPVSFQAADGLTRGKRYGHRTRRAADAVAPA